MLIYSIQQYQHSIEDMISHLFPTIALRYHSLLFHIPRLLFPVCYFWDLWQTRGPSAQAVRCVQGRILLMFGFSIGCIPRFGAFWKVTVYKPCLSGSSKGWAALWGQASQEPPLPARQQGQWLHRAGGSPGGPQPGEGAGPGMAARVGDSPMTTRRVCRDRAGQRLSQEVQGARQSQDRGGTSLAQTDLQLRQGPEVSCRLQAKDQRLQARCLLTALHGRLVQVTKPCCIRAGLEQRQQNLYKGKLPGGTLRALTVLWLRFNSVLSIGSSALQRIGAAGGTHSQRRSGAPWRGSVTSNRALRFRTRTSQVL